MASMELDPIFMKALALLRSKTKDSTDLLKQMLDDILGRTTGKVSQRSKVSQWSKFTPKPSSPAKMASKSEKTEAGEKKSAVKRTVEKSSFGAALSSGDSSVVPKKAKMETEVRPSRIQPRKPVIDDDDDDDDHGEDEDDDDTEEEPMEEKEEKTSQSSGDEDNDADFEIEDEKIGSAGDDDEMWLGLVCVVCKELGISAGNTLIECQECHNLYHQKCHVPPVTDSENDPRQVWYCAKCKRNMKKVAVKKPTSLPETVITTGSSSSSSSSSSSQSTSGKDGEKGQDSSMNLFRRADPKPSPTSTTSKQQPFGGLASYAANLNSRQHSSSSSSSSSSSKSNPLGQSRIITPGGSKLLVPPAATITGRSSSASGSASSAPSRPSSLKPQPVQRSTSVSQAGNTKGSSSSSSSSFAQAATSASSSGGAKGGGGNSATGKAMPQTSTASAMKRLHMMKKKASKR